MRQSTRNQIQKEIYKTLAYSDLFAYPLTGKQLFSFLGIPIRGADFLEVAKKIPHVMYKNTIYYFLPRRGDIVIPAIAKKKISLAKIQLAKKIAHLLSYIPTVQFVGITGSLALLHADKKSDIDLFIITKEQTVWLTRLCVYALLMLLGVKRNTKSHTNGFCANLFLDETDLSFPNNLYTAHEIAQVMPLLNKNKTYEKFLLVNKWVQHYFPNLIFPKEKRGKKIKKSFSFFSPFEYILRSLQLWYMRKKVTRETLTPSRIAFHPIDYQTVILTAYEKKIKKYRLYSSSE